MSRHLQTAESLNKTNTPPSAGAIGAIIEHLKENNFGLWQVCPKCEGEGLVDALIATLPNAKRTCPLCEGEGKLVRPEIKEG